MHPNTLIDDEVVEDVHLSNENDFQRIEWDYSEWSMGSCSKVNQHTISAILFAETELKRERTPNVVATQRPGCAKKSRTGHGILQFRSLFTFEPWKFTTTNGKCFNAHTHKAAHFDTFAVNNFPLSIVSSINFEAAPITSEGILIVRGTNEIRTAMMQSNRYFYCYLFTFLKVLLLLKKGSNKENFNRFWARQCRSNKFEGNRIAFHQSRATSWT